MTEQKIKDVELEIVESKKQVESVIVNVLERGDKLEDLENKAEDLKEAGALFAKESKKVKRKMWWQKSKVHFCIAVVVVVIVGIIVLAIVL